jgi:hypothetical protein
MKEKFSAKDERLKCHGCNVPKPREEWGKLVTTEYFAIDDMPRHGKQRMWCKACMIDKYTKQEGQEDDS